MNTFGVCRCDLSAWEPVIEDLVRFDTYEEACSYYKEHAFIDNDQIDKYLWIVWFREDGKACQFEKLSWDIKCKLIKA